MGLSQQLQKFRANARLTQQQVADVLRVPRESISMWEKGTRVPGLRQLEDLARLYSVSVQHLLGEAEEIPHEEEREILCRGLVPDPAVHLQLRRWFDFLDEWADIIEDGNFGPRNNGKPPKKLDRGPDFTDSRQAPSLAAEVRNFYNLGTNAIADMYSLLDELGILVCKANLGDWTDNSKVGISGVFHNHKKLGYCILVNAEHSLGRQSFTLAHEFGHALYHYNCSALISIKKDSNPRENFADAFATHFLVPAKELNRLIEACNWKNQLDPLKAITLAHSFQVSYVFMLIRLRNEKHITEDERKAWSSYSPSALAQQIGLEPGAFHKPGMQVLDLGRYPASVLQIVRALVSNDDLSVSQAADLLNVSHAQIKTLMFTEMPQATADEKQELCEFSF